MDHSTVSLLIHRVCTGKFYFSYNENQYVLIQPDPETKYQAELLYHNYIQSNKYYILFTKYNIKNLLNFLNLWSDYNEKSLKDLEKQTDNIKLNMFLNKLNTEKVKRLRKELSTTRESINKLLNQKHSLDYLTIEDSANLIKNEFIMINTILHNDEKTKVFNTSPENISYVDFMELTSYIANSFISIESYKHIARSDQWKAIWNSNKNNLFYGKSAYEFSDEQKTLISITNMYDKIYEHPECPEDYIIHDDDMLDGWMIYQKNKSDKAKKQGMASELNNRHKNAKEIFVMSDREDIDNIMHLNSDQSLAIIKQRTKKIAASQDGIDEVFLPDVQRELLQQVNNRR